jgi:hypothetical protein
MTDRIKAITVVLADNMREDDANETMAAIQQLRHVVSVDAHIADVNHHSAKMQVRAEMQDRVWKAIFGD